MRPKNPKIRGKPAALIQKTIRDKNAESSIFSSVSPPPNVWTSNPEKPGTLGWGKIYKIWPTASASGNKANAVRFQSPRIQNETRKTIGARTRKE